MSIASILLPNGTSEEIVPNGMVHSLTSVGSTAGSSTSGSVLSVKWTVADADGITTPFDGMKCMIRIPRVGVSTGGVVLSIDNGTTYHPVAYNVNTALTSHYAVNSNKVFIYNASLSMTCYLTAGTATTVTGVWQADADYDSNTTTTYGTLAYYFRPYAAAAVYRYKLVVSDKDNRVVPLTDRNVIGPYSSSTSYAKDECCVYNGQLYISLVASNKGHTPNSSASYWSTTTMTPTALSFRPDKIYLYNTSTATSAGGVTPGNVLTSVGYSSNYTTMASFTRQNNSWAYVIPAYRVIYLCGTYNKTTGLFTLKSAGVAGASDYYTIVPDNTANITLSSYFTAGYDYIYVGGTYSSNDYFHLREDHPMYHFDGTNLVPYDKTELGQDIVVSQKTASASGAYMTASAFSASPPSGVAGQVLFVIQGV